MHLKRIGKIDKKVEDVIPSLKMIIIEIKLV